MSFLWSWASFSQSIFECYHNHFRHGVFFFAMVFPFADFLHLFRLTVILIGFAQSRPDCPPYLKKMDKKEKFVRKDKKGNPLYKLKVDFKTDFPRVARLFPTRPPPPPDPDTDLEEINPKAELPDLLEKVRMAHEILGEKESVKELPLPRENGKPEKGQYVAVWDDDSPVSRPEMYVCTWDPVTKTGVCHCGKHRGDCRKIRTHCFKNNLDLPECKCADFTPRKTPKQILHGTSRVHTGLVFWTGSKEIDYVSGCGEPDCTKPPRAVVSKVYYNLRAGSRRGLYSFVDVWAAGRFGTLWIARCVFLSPIPKLESSEKKNRLCTIFLIISTRKKTLVQNFSILFFPLRTCLHEFSVNLAPKRYEPKMSLQGDKGSTKDVFFGCGKIFFISGFLFLSLSTVGVHVLCISKRRKINRT